MSFSQLVKDEILSQKNKTAPCCERALLLGMLLFCARCDPEQIRFTTENEKLIKRICSLLRRAFGIVKTPERQKNIPSDMPLYTVAIRDPNELSNIFRAYKEGLNSRGQGPVVIEMEQRRCCLDAILKGAFLSGGYVTNPEKEYHLEFVAPGGGVADGFSIFLREGYGFSPRSVRRKQSTVVYFKESENIEDLLSLMGATNSALSIMEIKVEKDVRNKINRQVNCETANLTKTVDAYEKHKIAIEKIARSPGLQSLPPQLCEIAGLRLSHPELSLKELGERLTKPISKSGVNHRLNKIIEIAQSQENREEKA